MVVGVGIRHCMEHASSATLSLLDSIVLELELVIFDKKKTLHKINTILPPQNWLYLEKYGSYIKNNNCTGCLLDNMGISCQFLRFFFLFFFGLSTWPKV